MFYIWFELNLTNKKESKVNIKDFPEIQINVREIVS